MSRVAIIGASRIVVGRSDPGLLPVIDQEGGANLSLPGIALEMRGGDIILRADVSTAGAPQTYAGPIRLGVAPAAADVTLTGSLVTVGGIDVAAGVSNVRFSGGGSIRNPGMQGIQFNGTSTNSLVRGFTITAAGMTGIKFASGDYTGTRAIGNSIDGAGLSTYGFRLGSATGLSIGGGLLGDGNRVTGTYQGLYASGGLAGTSVLGNTITGNVTNITVDPTAAATGTFQAT